MSQSRLREGVGAPAGDKAFNIGALRVTFHIKKTANNNPASVHWVVPTATLTLLIRSRSLTLPNAFCEAKFSLRESHCGDSVRTPRELQIPADLNVLSAFSLQFNGTDCPLELRWSQ